ncbi:Chaperonin CPN60 [Citrus sinensis]|uniref:Chaperonin CPN60 n=1 Tax=Citrus sinensis TaxID=2711 RepID=A0ACB8N479_CITSI|nr:Chaperonin CPN60 [Citrus sinensis]
MLLWGFELLPSKLEGSSPGHSGYCPSGSHSGTNSKVKRDLVEALIDGEFYMREDAEVPDQRQGARMAIDALVGNLYSTAQPITSFEQIALFGTAAANGDRVIGELIAKAFEKGWGNNLHVLADRKTPPSIELQLYWGMTLDRGYLSPYFITNHKTKECVLRDPYIMILEKKVSNCVFFDLLTEIGPVRRYNGTDVLIIAEDIENDLLASLVLNGVATATKACSIKPPGFGESRKASLRDIAKFTYGKVMTGKDFQCISLGHAEKLLQWRFTMENLQDFPEESRTKHSYLAAVIKVCGSNKAEVREKKDRVANAINAVKAAKEGVVSVMSLLYACKELDKLQTANHGQKIGVQAIQYALEMLVSAIAYSAGVDGSVVSKLLEGSKPKPLGKGENADMLMPEIVFPLKTIRAVLVEATSEMLARL